MADGTTTVLCVYIVIQFFIKGIQPLESLTAPKITYLLYIISSWYLANWPSSKRLSPVFAMISISILMKFVFVSSVFAINP